MLKKDIIIIIKLRVLISILFFHKKNEAFRASKNKKGLTSVILAPIRLKFELVIYILTEVNNFVKKKIKKKIKKL